MSSPDLLIFDMDGVLVDVSESYRETIQCTVEHFTGKRVSAEQVQDFKNQGGFNDDWLLSHRLITDAGVDVSFDAVVEHFQAIFRGPNGNNGLILGERWMPEDGLLDRLAERHHLAIFTGRFREEADVTIERFAPDRFDPIVGADNVQSLKPHPEGLLKIRELVPHQRAFYVGDTVDDAQSAKAAGVPFVGIVGSTTPRREQTVAVLRDEGAIAVLRDVNGLEEVLQAR